MLEQATRDKIIAALEAEGRPDVMTLSKRFGVQPREVWCLYQLIERKYNVGFGAGTKTNRALAYLRTHPEDSDIHAAKAVGCTPSHMWNVRKLLEYLQTDPATAPHYGPIKKRKAAAPAAPLALPAPATPPKAASEIDKILNERGKDYGDYLQKAGFIQTVKFLMRSSPSWNDMDADMQESMEMIVHKMGRALYGEAKLKDNFVDIAGYAKLVADRL